jgi:hypothetical protein
MAKSKDVISAKESPTVISDSGRVRMGSSSPAFPPARGAPANTGDTGKVRMGNTGPAFLLMRPLVEVGTYSASSSGSTADAPKIRIAASGAPTVAPARSR